MKAIIRRNTESPKTLHKMVRAEGCRGDRSPREKVRKRFKNIEVGVREVGLED